MAEGIQSLSLAFLHAGARAAVGTAWSVEDQAAARLVEETYARLLAGDDVGDALAGAQRAAQGPRPWQRAADWAGFALHGDPAARPSLVPTPSRPWLDPRVALATLAAALALALLPRRRLRR
jgi:hypothetical protein